MGHAYELKTDTDSVLMRLLIIVILTEALFPVVAVGQRDVAIRMRPSTSLEHRFHGITTFDRSLDLSAPSLDLQLVDKSGRPYIPASPVSIDLDIRGNTSTKQTVTIEPLKPLSVVRLPAQTAGTVEVRASDTQDPQRFAP